MPPPSVTDVLPLNVFPTRVSWAPPCCWQDACGQVGPQTGALPAIVASSWLSKPPPPNDVVELLVNVLLVTVALPQSGVVVWHSVASSSMAPPCSAMLPLKVLLVTVRTPLSWLSMAPPPVEAWELLFRKVTPVTVNKLRLMIAAPPWLGVPDAAGVEPLLSVTLLMSKLPLSSTMKNRKSGVPPAVDRVIVAPLPTIVTLPVMSAKAFGPSAVLSTAVIVYVQPAVSVTVPPDAETAAIAVTRAAALHGTGAAPVTTGVATTLAKATRQPRTPIVAVFFMRRNEEARDRREPSADVVLLAMAYLSDCGCWGHCERP